MSRARMAGMQLAAQEILTIGETLDTDQWQMPSAASGWSVQDVVVHTGCLLGLLMAAVGGAVLPETGITGIEALNDIQVAEKRGWNSRQALEALSRTLTKRWRYSPPCRMNHWRQSRLRCSTSGPTHCISSSTCSPST
jgi:hypothetical protein